MYIGLKRNGRLKSKNKRPVKMETKLGKKTGNERLRGLKKIIEDVGNIMDSEIRMGAAVDVRGKVDCKIQDGGRNELEDRCTACESVVSKIDRKMKEASHLAYGRRRVTCGGVALLRQCAESLKIYTEAYLELSEWMNGNKSFEMYEFCCKVNRWCKALDDLWQREKKWVYGREHKPKDDETIINSIRNDAGVFLKMYFERVIDGRMQSCVTLYPGNANCRENQWRYVVCVTVTADEYEKFIVGEGGYQKHLNVKPDTRIKIGDSTGKVRGVQWMRDGVVLTDGKVYMHFVVEVSSQDGIWRAGLCSAYIAEKSYAEMEREDPLMLL